MGNMLSTLTATFSSIATDMFESAHQVCYECLQISKGLTVQACEAIEEYYSDVAIVFSGKEGVPHSRLRLQLRDWTPITSRNPIKSHEVARYKFSKK
jgi:hypothetical protein